MIAPQTEGVQGQLAIGGPQLAMGYVKLPELTAERFIMIGSGVAPGDTAAEYLTAGAKGQQRVYLTGDLARWEHRELRLLGRFDRQVKVNGVRLELGEVEGVLASCSLVKQAAALLLDGSLVASVELQSGTIASSAEAKLPGYDLATAVSLTLIRLHARRWLSAAATPRRAFILESLPTTPTGKIDRQALAELMRQKLAAEAHELTAAAASTSSGSASPGMMSTLEQAVASTWAEVLQVPLEHIRRASHFIVLGGDSIKALQVARFLSMHLRHAHEAAPSRKHDNRASLINAREAVDDADYGVLRGVFSAIALLRRPLLHVYSQFLLEAGVSVPSELLQDFATVAQSGVDLARAQVELDDGSNLAGGSLAAVYRNAAASDREWDPLLCQMRIALEQEREQGARQPLRAKGGAPEERPGSRGAMSWPATLRPATPTGDGSESVDAGQEEIMAEVATLAELEGLLAEEGGEQRLLQRCMAAAARLDSTALVSFALSLGADPAPRPKRFQRQSATLNDFGPSPLHVACTHGHTRIVELLLHASAPPTLISAAGIPVLHAAAAHPIGSGALLLLLNARAPLAMRDDRQQTALHAAARAGNISALQLLVKAGADPEFNPRCLRAASEHTPSYLEMRDRWHRTALHWAVINARTEAVAFLISAGASVHGVRMPVGKHLKSTSLPLEPPLHSAARLPVTRGAAQMCELLLRHGAQVDNTDQFGQTALHVAFASEEEDRAEIIRVLIKSGAQLQCVDFAGRTPAECAHHLFEY